MTPFPTIEHQHVRKGREEERKVVSGSEAIERDKEMNSDGSAAPSVRGVLPSMTRSYPRKAEGRGAKVCTKKQTGVQQHSHHLRQLLFSTVPVDCAARKLRRRAQSAHVS